MKILPALILAGLATLPMLSAARPESAPPAASRQADRDIAALIRELADESFRVRENATRGIWEMGEAALPSLKEVLASADPEQVFRARDLIRKIQLHITPETDASVIALVERYQKASPSEKTALLGRMKVKRAWRQMLKLYAAETSAEIREKLRPSMAGVAVRAARERLSQGDAKGAREFLEMAPADADSLLALAEFHRSHGSLAAELERAKAVKGPKSAAWQLALYRASGDLNGAREAALAAGENRISAAMAALAGDPLPWLKELGRDAQDDPIATAYANAATKRWLGQKVRPAELEPLTRPLAARDAADRGAAMNALFLLGEVALAEPAFAKAEPLAAFRHFDSLERIPEALKAFGLDPVDPDYKPWVEKRMEKLTADDIEDQHGVTTHREEVITLANFLERRGLHDEAFEVFSPPMAALAEKDAAAFMEFLGELFGGRESLSGAPQLAKRVGIAWAGEDDKRWADLLIAGFGDDEETSGWWDWLAELDPKSGRPERFDAMLALFRLGKDPGRLREKWLALAWKNIEATPPGKRDDMVVRISTLSGQTGDVANSLRAWELLPEAKRDEVFWGQHIIHLSAAGRWQDAAAVILKQIARMEEGNQEPSADLHAYAASALRLAGRADEAATHDQWVDKLALGNASLARRIGNGYAYGGDYKRAAAWWARAAWESDPDSGEFAVAMKLHSDTLLEEGRWKEAAATSEIVARTYASAEYNWTSPLPFMRQRLQADMAHALANLQNNRSQSLAVLAACHRTFISDGSLADFFFPALRKMGLQKEHDAWFHESWELMQDMISRYPDSDNTRNTAAWFASRAMLKLDEAEQHLKIALAASPEQPAYLDTMAEIQFAEGNRKKALEWSRLAVNFEPDEAQLRRQQERFRSDPLPK